MSCVAWADPAHDGAQDSDVGRVEYLTNDMRDVVSSLVRLAMT